MVRPLAADRMLHCNALTSLQVHAPPFGIKQILGFAPQWPPASHIALANSLDTQWSTPVRRKTGLSPGTGEDVARERRRPPYYIPCTKKVCNSPGTGKSTFWIFSSRPLSSWRPIGDFHESTQAEALTRLLVTANGQFPQGNSPKDLAVFSRSLLWD